MTPITPSLRLGPFNLVSFSFARRLITEIGSSNGNPTGTLGQGNNLDSILMSTFKPWLLPKFSGDVIIDGVKYIKVNGMLINPLEQKDKDPNKKKRRTYIRRVDKKTGKQIGPIVIKHPVLPRYLKKKGFSLYSCPYCAKGYKTWSRHECSLKEFADILEDIISKDRDPEIVIKDG